MHERSPFVATEEAAAALDALTARVEALEEALTPFAALAQDVPLIRIGRPAALFVSPAVKIADVERAAALLDFHASDCAVHNAPALPIGPCNCFRAALEPKP